MDTLKSPTLAHARILVVDDHPTTATTLARAIAQLGPGIEAISANSGENALALVQDNPVDILITDMVMTGINGLELVEKLQSLPGCRPAYIILITAYDVPGLKITARRLKVNEVFIKPVRPERICQFVANAIEDLDRTPPAINPEAKPTPKILVADDLPDNVALLSRYLENEGFHCIPAVNGAEALAKIRTEMPDMVLLDMNMPVKDGFETLKEIRSDPAIGHIPVIILTAARLEPKDMQSALNMGADDYVTKPFNRRELLARIRTRLRVKEAEDIVRRRNKELNLLPEIGRALSARLDVDELTDIVLHRTVETLGAYQGHIILFESNGQFHKTYRFADAAHQIEMKLPDLAPILTQVKDSHQGFIISDVQKDLRWSAASEELTHSVVVVPMFGRFDLLGLLVLAHEHSGYFLPEHMFLLQALASQAATAIENAHLYTGLKQEHQRLNNILQCTTDAILMFDTQKKLSLFNTAAQKLFASNQIQLGQPLSPSAEHNAFINLLEQAETTQTPQTYNITWSGGKAYTVLITPIAGGCVTVLHDISEVKQPELANEKYLAASLHNLLDKIVAIQASSLQLTQVGSLNTEQQNITQTIQKAVLNMDELVRNMLVLTKPALDAPNNPDTYKLPDALTNIEEPIINIHA